MEAEKIEFTEQELEAMLAEKKAAAKAKRNAEVSAYKKKLNDFIDLSIATAIPISEAMALLKKDVVVRGNELHDLMYEVYEREPKDLQKFSLVSDDGLRKVEIDRAPIHRLDETAEVHIATIKQVIYDKYAKVNKGFYAMVNDLLLKGNSEDYDPKMVVKLRKHSDTVNDIRFDNSLDGLSRATYQSGTSIYSRFYIKNEVTSKWELLPMQFSSI